jgi:hypothetical protein
MPDTKHLLNRIAFGPRPGDIQRIQQLGADKYIEQQLHPDRIEDHATEELLAGMPSIRMNTSEIMSKYPQPQQVARRLGFKAGDPESRRRVQEMLRDKGMSPPQQLASAAGSHDRLLVQSLQHLLEQKRRPVADDRF